MMTAIIRSVLLLTLAVTLLNAGSAACGPQKSALQNKRVVARGPLTGTREAFRIVIWQTANPQFPSAPYAIAHLAIETYGPKPRLLWQTDGGDSLYLVDRVRLAKLDLDDTPFITSLWWAGASAGAVLRIFHWDRLRDSFIEIPSNDDLAGIHDYKIKRSPSRPDRLVIYVRSDSGSRLVAGGEYELSEGRLVRAEESNMNSGNRTDSGIEGETVIGPTKPVLHQGDSGPDTEPYQTELIVTTNDGREVARIKTDSRGRFHISLPPGEYVIKQARTGQGRFLPRAQDHAIKVVRGEFTFVRITFDSGIR